MAAAKKNINKVQKNKKIKKIAGGNGAITGRFSFNNTIMSLCKENGEVLVQFSAGSIGYRGSKKSTSYAAQKVSEKIIEMASEYGICNVKLKLKNVGPGRDAVMRKVMESENIKVTELIDTTPIKFGGTRSKRKPRK
jgi:small subunit ribosomal protein S11